LFANTAAQAEAKARLEEELATLARDIDETKHSLETLEPAILQVCFSKKNL
jgi:hypothetical protein